MSFFFFFQVKTRVRISAVSVVGGELGARGKWARSESTRNMYANLTRVMQLVAGNKVGDSKQASTRTGQAMPNFTMSG